MRKLNPDLLEKSQIFAFVQQHHMQKNFPVAEFSPQTMATNFQSEQQYLRKTNGSVHCSYQQLPHIITYVHSQNYVNSHYSFLKKRIYSYNQQQSRGGVCYHQLAECSLYSGQTTAQSKLLITTKYQEFSGLRL